MGINKKQAKFISKLMECLKTDPCASDYQKNYEETEGYLYELIEKKGSVLGGLINGMEMYLKK